MVERVDVPADWPTNVGVWRRISWGAIFAGVFIALAVQVTLWLLGAGIGLSMVSPAQGEGLREAIGLGAAVWWIISTLIALFIGGWVAAHLAGVVQRMDGALHGLVTWGLTTVLAIVTMGTALSALGGVAAGSRQGQSALSSLSPQISQSFRQEARVQRVEERINNEARQLVQQGGKATGDKLQDAQDDVTDAISDVLDDPSQDNRQAAVKALMDNTKLNRQDAQSRVDQWVQRYNQAKPEYREAGTPQAKKAEKVTTIASRTALATFVMLVRGAGAALGGGYVGRPSDYWTTDRPGRTDTGRRNV